MSQAEFVQQTPVIENQKLEKIKCSNCEMTFEEIEEMVLHESNCAILQNQLDLVELIKEVS